VSGHPFPGPSPFRPPSVSPALTPKRRRRVVENDDYAAFVRRAVAAHGRRIASGDVEGLADMIALVDQLGEAIQAGVTGLRGHGYSWTEIGRVAGITKQSAHQRWSGAGEPEQAAGGDRGD
jgi:hypothetical protein